MEVFFINLLQNIITWFVSKAFKWIVFIAVMIAGIICSIELYYMFSVENAEYGTPITIATENNQEEVVKYELNYIDFISNDDSTGYIAEYEYSSIDNFNGEENDYVIYFNGFELINDTQSAGTISSEFVKKFYNTDNELLATVSINIDIISTVSLTKLTITTNNTSEELSYFSTYMTLNGSTILVAKESIL